MKKLQYFIAGLSALILSLCVAVAVAGPPSPDKEPQRQYLSWLDAFVMMDLGYCVRREGWDYPRSKGCVFKRADDEHMRWWLPNIRNGQYPAWGYYLPDMTDDWVIAQ